MTSTLKSSDRAFRLTPQDIARYHDDGFLFLRGLFDVEEIGLLRRAMEEDPAIRTHSLLRADQEGGATRIALWNRAGDSVYGLAARSSRVVDAAEALIGEPVYHFQSKLTAKEPRTGGAWEWHQDYGYWYYNGCLYPLLASCLIAVSRSTRENGCLQVLRGSQQLGRIDHVRTGDQTGADMERVEAAVRQLELVYVEAEPGDALLFDGNLLHRSDQNRADYPRWSLICCYNAARNSPYKVTRHPAYSPLAKVDDDAILGWKPDGK